MLAGHKKKKGVAFKYREMCILINYTILLRNTIINGIKQSKWSLLMSTKTNILTLKLKIINKMLKLKLAIMWKKTLKQMGKLMLIFIVLTMILWCLLMLVEIHILILNLKVMKKIVNLKLAVMWEYLKIKAFYVNVVIEIRLVICNSSFYMQKKTLMKKKLLEHFIKKSCKRQIK